MAEAGYPDGFSTQMVIRGTSGEHLDQAQVYQQDLAAIGVDLELVPTELPQYWPILFDSDFTIVSHATGDATVDPSGLFEGAACCRPFRNFFGITEDDTWFPEYEQIILEARARAGAGEARRAVSPCGGHPAGAGMDDSDRLAAGSLCAQLTAWTTSVWTWTG